MTDLIFEEIPGQAGNLGQITLNRQQALNALNHPMLLELDKQLSKWAVDPQIKAVIIRAAPGRAFCAGGDIRSAYEKHREKDPSLPYFFRDEYRLNCKIFHFPKPYIALLDGMTMGGGSGISINGSHRIATERLVFAMPETGIGFFPDVGASYFLSRIAHKIGFYLGLSCARLSGADCFALGLVNHYVAVDALDAIVKALAETSLAQHPKQTVTTLIEQFHIASTPSECFAHPTGIETCFSKNTMEEILAALENLQQEWSLKTATVLKTKSPTSLKVTLRALQQGMTMSFDHCMQMEYRLTSRFITGHDFFEGIRAAVIDKDQTPVWKPAFLKDVSEEDINEYFAPLTQELV